MLASLLLTFFDLFVLAMNALIIARIVASWVAPQSAIYQTLSDLTEPILAPVRKLMPEVAMIDLAPLITILALNLIQTGVHSLIFRV